ncbi:MULTISPECIES: SCP2 sterol-binding domain-containing protein [Streptomyces]|uniref:SCP2 sterol-binding domain-containing protein n=1 Tax=Streptomyces chilikensis TaxID=1194079 RepID=A0ABV3EP70_9ACTN|nr:MULTISPECIES: SCP2 sterol-binding domain-containing protein [Streptomyces]MDH6227636.1 putative lipid carrier protein YhbT [Streptomyces sp. MJP52]
MATIEECRAALEELAGRLASAPRQVREAASPERSVSCHVTDLDVTFTGRLAGGRLEVLDAVPGQPAEPARIRLSATGDDLLALVAGTLPFPRAWATGRLKLDAPLRDLLRLRSLL